MPVTCLIVFDDNPQGIYFAGQVVTGKVTLHTTEVLKTHGVVLKIKGLAHTNWTEGSGRNSRTYVGNELFLNLQTNLMGSNDSTLFNIEPGTCSYKFACQLPRTCPSSYEGLYGYIRYTVKVRIMRSWQFDERLTRDFTVAKIMDLNNDDPKLYAPITVKACKNFGIGPWKSDPLTITVNIPQHGYTAGQIIPVDVLLNNESDVRVEELKVSLVMHIYHHSQSPSARTKVQRIKVTKFKGEGVQSYCTKNLKFEILIPATPPTCTHLCQIIQIGYEVEVEAKVEGLHTNQFVALPVFICYKPPPKMVDQHPVSEAELRIEMLEIDSEHKFVEKSSDPANVKELKDVSIKKTIVQGHREVSSSVPPCFEETITEKSEELRRLSEASASWHPPMTPPPSFEEASGSLYLNDEACSQRNFSFIPIENNFVTRQGAQERRRYAVFEEAIHLERLNPRKNALSPKYPFVRDNL